MIKVNSISGYSRNLRPCSDSNKNQTKNVSFGEKPLTSVKKVLNNMYSLLASGEVTFTKGNGNFFAFIPNNKNIEAQEAVNAVYDGFNANRIGQEIQSIEGNKYINIYSKVPGENGENIKLSLCTAGKNEGSFVKTEYQG